MELEVSRLQLHQKKTERQLSEIQFKFTEERKKRKKERRGRKVGIVQSNVRTYTVFNLTPGLWYNDVTLVFAAG